MFVGFSTATLAIFEFGCEVEEHRISCKTWRERDAIRGLLMARYLHELLLRTWTWTWTAQECGK